MSEKEQQAPPPPPPAEEVAPVEQRQSSEYSKNPGEGRTLIREGGGDSD